MTAEQIDSELQLWQSRMEATARGLAELSALPAWQMVEKLELTGETKERIGPAVLAVQQVWRDFDLLAKTVQQATQLRAKISAFSFSRQSWNEIEALLTERCLPADEQIHMAANQITLKQLHERMSGAFGQGHDGVLAIDASWKAIQKKLAGAKQFLDAHAGEMAELRRAVEALRPRVLPDPLGANREFDGQIAGALQQAQGEMAKREEQRGHFRANLATARQLIQTLDDLRIQNEAAWRECQEKISGRLAEPALAEQRIHRWDQVIGNLEKQSSGAAFDRACEELARSISELQQLVTHEQSVLRQNRAPVELRRELRGRLTALKAKASARGRSEEPELARLGERAKTLLYSRPTPIDEAMTAVSDYQALLNEQETKRA